MKAYYKDIWRAIKHNKKRFFSMMLITILGVTMLTGLRAACQDLRITADAFYDDQNLYDICVVSTLGLTDEDVEALASLQEIEAAEGTYSEKVKVWIGEQNKSAEVKLISEQGISMPYLQEGQLPVKADEIAVTENFLIATGKQIGDIVIIDEEEEEADEDSEETAEPNFRITEYTITGIVIDPTNVNSQDEMMEFRSNLNADYTFFVMPEAVESDVYTAVYLTVKNTDELMCYESAYEEKIQNIVDKINVELKEARQQARYDEITGEALEEVAEAKAEADEEFAKADKEIADGKAELEDARAELADGKAEIEDARTELEDGKAEIAKSKAEIADGFKQLEDGQAKLDQEREQLMQSESQLAQMAQIPGMDISAMQQQIEAGKVQLDAAQAELDKNRQKLIDGQVELEKAEAEILDGEKELSEGEAELLEGEEELLEGEAELQENIEKLEKERKDAYQEIADAEAEIRDIEMAQWYIQDRNSLSSYANIESDAACIESVGRVFPIIFFIVAILIGLTTITRMVEEERGLIGTYKALGFSDREIRRKYLLYASSASILGGLIGDICGFIVLPKIIFVIFAVLYELPEYVYSFDSVYGIGGVVLFAGGLVVATWAACEAELRHMPAKLMRPKSPKAGSRVFLERVTPVWSRLSFLNKVTARNLFRYKKRLFMTVGGITGCTALLLCGFVVKDSVSELLKGQYQRIYAYDILAVAAEDENNTLLDYIEEIPEVEEYQILRIDSLKIMNQDGKEESVQLFVLPNGEDLKNYIRLENALGEEVELVEDGILVTQNAANRLIFDVGDTVFLQNLKLVQKEVKVSGLVTNYLGNNVYMTQDVYEELFGEFKPNGTLINLEENSENDIAIADELEAREGILTVDSVQERREQFAVAFYLIEVLVYIIIVMAAGLALVVLFTLATTNISERERELATIKVLGFYDKEVHLYVNKETLILTGIGIVLGLPIGRFLGGCLTNALNMPAIYFAVKLHPVSYLIVIALSVGFALFVDFLTDRTLDHIDPVEALKSIE